MATSHITDFIQSLNPEELKFTKKYISSENKIKQLLTILTEEPERKFSDQELARLLNSSTQSVRVLKSRLFDKIKEALSHDEHFENPAIFNERERTIFPLKKKALFAKSLFRKLDQNRKGIFAQLLNEIEETGKKHQAFDVLIEMLTLKKQLIGLREGVSKYENITNQIVFYDKCYKGVQNANDNYYHLVLNQEFTSSLTKKEKEQQTLLAIKSMQADYNFTKSDEINYYLQILKIALYENKKDYTSALKCCKTLLILVKDSSIVHSKDRMGFAMGNLCLFNIYLGSYKQANSFAKKGQQFHIPHSLNHLVLKEQEFYSSFYDGNYTNAEKCVSEMLQHSSLDTGEFRKSKFVYFQAAVLFHKAQYKEALKLLNRSLEIEKDKTGWNIWVRLLLIMIYVELSKTKEASTAIASLRKHQERTSKKGEIKERDVLIFKLLRELEKDNFKRNERNKTAAKLIAELSDKDKSTAWNYFTPELIPFHEWVITLPAKN